MTMGPVTSSASGRLPMRSPASSSSSIRGSEPVALLGGGFDDVRRMRGLSRLPCTTWPHASGGVADGMSAETNSWPTRASRLREVANADEGWLRTPPQSGRNSPLDLNLQDALKEQASDLATVQTAAIPEVLTTRSLAAPTKPSASASKPCPRPPTAPPGPTPVGDVAGHYEVSNRGRRPPRGVRRRAASLEVRGRWPCLPGVGSDRPPTPLMRVAACVSGPPKQLFDPTAGPPVEQSGRDATPAHPLPG